VVAGLHPVAITDSDIPVRGACWGGLGLGSTVRRMTLRLPDVVVLRRTLEIAQGTAYWSPLVGLTLDEDPLVDPFLRDLVLVQGRTEKTTKSYAEWLVPAIKYRHALHLSWSALAVEDRLASFLRWRREAYRPKAKGPGSLGASTASMKLMRVALTGLYRYGFDRGLLDEGLAASQVFKATTLPAGPHGVGLVGDPRSVLRVGSGKGSVAAEKAARRRREQRPYLTDGEFLQLLQATRSVRDQCILCWLRAPGLRVGQLVTVKRDRVHPAAYTDCTSSRLGAHLHIEQPPDHPHHAGVKIDAAAVVPLGSTGVELYREWLSERLTIPPARLSPWLFVTLPGGPTAPGQALSTQAVRSMLHAACARAGIRRVHPHMLRHSAGQAGADLGMPPDVLQQLLAHRSIHSQQVYRRVSDDRASQAVEALESYRVAAVGEGA
jgi:integrase/recombinase XerD